MSHLRNHVRTVLRLVEANFAVDDGTVPCTGFASPFDVASLVAELQLMLHWARAEQVSPDMRIRLQTSAQLIADALPESGMAQPISHQAVQSLRWCAERLGGVEVQLTPQRAVSATPSAKDLVSSICCNLDQHHQRDGLKLGNTEPKKFAEIASNLQVRADTVTRAMKVLLGLDGDGQKPHNVYKHLCTTGRHRGLELARLLARHAGEEQVYYKGELRSDYIPTLSEASAAQIAEAREMLDGLQPR